jgi:hypothetical protein
MVRVPESDGPPCTSTAKITTVNSNGYNKLKGYVLAQSSCSSSAPQFSCIPAASIPSVTYWRYLLRGAGHGFLTHPSIQIPIRACSLWGGGNPLQSPSIHSKANKPSGICIGGDLIPSNPPQSTPKRTSPQGERRVQRAQSYRR